MRSFIYVDCKFISLFLNLCLHSAGVCRYIVSQSQYLSNSNKECDWLNLAPFIREQYTADAIENSSNAWGNHWGFFYHKTNKKPRLCSVVKHLGSGRALEKKKNSTASRVFPNPSFVLYRFLCALQQNRTRSKLLSIC